MAKKNRFKTARRRSFFCRYRILSILVRMVHRPRSWWHGASHEWRHTGTIPSFQYFRSHKPNNTLSSLWSFWLHCGLVRGREGHETCSRGAEWLFGYDWLFLFDLRGACARCGPSTCWAHYALLMMGKLWVLPLQLMRAFRAWEPCSKVSSLSLHGSTIYTYTYGCVYFVSLN